MLESDVLRRVLTPEPRYDEAERRTFYGAMAWIGALLFEHGVDVIFDGTANRRAYRDRARSELPRFAEIHVQTALPVCVERDPKGIYARALDAGESTVPGLDASYEAPLSAELTLDGTADAAQNAATTVAWLEGRGWL